MDYLNLDLKPKRKSKNRRKKVKRTKRQIKTNEIKPKFRYNAGQLPCEDDDVCFNWVDIGFYCIKVII